MYPRVKVELCERCGTCIEICPSEVYQMGREAAETAFPDECIECGACAQQCPAECVALIED